MSTPTAHEILLVDKKKCLNSFQNRETRSIRSSTGNWLLEFILKSFQKQGDCADATVGIPHSHFVARLLMRISEIQGTEIHLDYLN